jgi:small subunit ribosomal protein S6
VNKYELALILNSALDEDGLKAEFDKVADLISRFGGEVEKVDNWGRRRFAYEIEKMNEGFYYFINFVAPNTTPAEVESRLRILESVVRYLIIRVEEPRKRKKQEKEAVVEEAVEEAVADTEETAVEVSVEPAAETAAETAEEPAAEAEASAEGDAN